MSGDRLSSAHSESPSHQREWGAAARRLLAGEAAHRRCLHANEALALELMVRLLSERARPRGVELLAGEVI